MAHIEAVAEYSGPIIALEFKHKTSLTEITMPAYSLTPQELSRREELTTRIKIYQGTRFARRRMEAELEKLGQRRNLPLPHELMGIIFDIYVHLYGQIPEVLLLVCRSWHVLALSQPALWTNLDPLGPFGLCTVRPWAGTFLQSRVSRSNPVPLKVDFSQWSQSTLPEDAEKIAGIRTFRSRIQELFISTAQELHYLIGSQPLLKHLTIGGALVFPLDALSENPAPYMLSEKMISTLRVKSSQEMHIWPESLLRRLQTLEVTLTGMNGRDWSMVQQSVALLNLWVNIYGISAPPLSHASCRSLTLVYCDWLCTMEELRMPRLQELTIITCSSHGLMRLTLVDTPISSLRLTHLAGPLANIHPVECAEWVDSAIRLLRSNPRLDRFEISAPLVLVVHLARGIRDDADLCTEVNTFIIDPPMGRDLEERIQEKYERLTTMLSDILDKRRLSPKN